jgi:DNA-cytosine methyltransferase
MSQPKLINCLSLFDGISSGQVSLQRAGVKVGQYFASEIDKHAIKVTQKNFPNTVQLGDVTKWREWDIDFSGIDLVLAGSPCQSFSLLGNQKGFGDHRGNLMLIFIDILNHIKSLNPEVKFLLENVQMAPTHIQEISKLINEEPIKLNSNQFVAQSRTRYYWSNFIWQKVKFADECEECKDCGEPYCGDCDKHYADCDCLGPNEDHIIFNNQANKGFRPPEEPKKYTEIVDEEGWVPATVRKSGPTKGGLRKVTFTNNIFGCLTASYYKGIRSDGRPAVAKREGLFNEMREAGEIRMLAPVECEKLQGLPENYSAGISNTQRYKAIGNGWTVDVIAHIFNNLPEEWKNKNERI